MTLGLPVKVTQASNSEFLGKFLVRSKCTDERLVSTLKLPSPLPLSRSATLCASAINKVDRSTKTRLASAASTLAPQEKVCYIITGAFGQKASIQKRLDQLIELGLAPYQDKQGKLTRVGIQFAYRLPSEIAEKMAILHENVEPKSWILEQ